MLGFNAVSNIILAVRIGATPKNLTIVAAYAPTEAADDQIKEEFYDQLQETWQSIRKEKKERAVLAHMVLEPETEMETA